MYLDFINTINNTIYDSEDNHVRASMRKHEWSMDTIPNLSPLPE